MTLRFWIIDKHGLWEVLDLVEKVRWSEKWKNEKYEEIYVSMYFSFKIALSYQFQLSMLSQRGLYGVLNLSENC